MLTSLFSPDQYQWLLSLYVLIGIVTFTLVARFFLLRIPAIKQTQTLNKTVAEKRNTRSYYPPIQNRSKIYGVITQLVIFILILPFCLTLESQSIWNMLLDVFVILMVYDFFYYLTHRFVFHDGPLGGPLIKVHAVHHQQKDPCRLDSNYLHPLETCIGLGLFAGCIAGLCYFMGDFHVATLIISWVAFSEINQHNHDRMDESGFPFKYVHYMSHMHHVHHSKFTSGNFATISLFYDWLFGTYDKGDGYKK